MKNRRFILLPIFLIFISTALIPVFIVNAQESTPSDDQVNAIAHQLYCPVCENTPLDVCPTTACHQWRELIRQMLAEGKSEAEIKQYFVDYYGARVLSEPPRSGIYWLVYVVPPVAFLAGAYLLFRAFQTWKRLARESKSDSPDSGPTGIGSSSAGHPDNTQDDDYVSRLEEELKKRK
jgi:cytochrome c-type biogenesis protein CcmH